MKKCFKSAFFYAVLAMIGGVFYREYTKFSGFTVGRTTLAFVHVHLFMLGMLFFLVLGLLDHAFAISKDRRFPLTMTVYHAGLLITVCMLVWRGILQVRGEAVAKAVDASISGIAGIGHIMLGVGIILFLLMLQKQAAKGK